MPSSFFGINIGASAIAAADVGLDVVGQNIANANTPGYSQQNVNLEQSIPYTPADAQTMIHPGMLGTGVVAASITRTTDQFVTQQLNAAQSESGNYTAQQNTLTSVENAFGEPSTTSLDNALSTFYQGFNNVANNPSNQGVRAAAIQNGVALANVFNNISGQLSDINTSLTNNINTDIGTINSDAQQIASLNGQIQISITEGQSPNDLEDQRDSLISSISKLVNVSTNTEPNGMIDVAIGGTALVSGLQANAVTAAGLQSTGDLTNGEVYGLTTAQSALQGYQSDLDSVASNVISQVNTVQAQGADVYGDTGANSTPFFTGTSASTIAVNPDMTNDPNLLAAGAANGGNPPAAGDGSNATNFANLQTQTVAGQPFNGQSVQQFYESTITDLGAATATATTAATSASSEVTQLTQAQQSVVGVSTDQQMVDMIQFQNMYQAAAKYISTTNTCLGDLMDMVGS